MAQSRQDEALAIAHALGVVQEAQRLGHRRVGSEHVLMSSMSDPIVRRALDGVGCDLRDVQGAVTRIGDERNRDECDRDDADGVDLTTEAADLITRAVLDVPGLDPADRDPAAYSRAFAAVMVAVLHDARDIAATRVLDELGVREHASGLVAAIHGDAGPSGLLVAD